MSLASDERPGATRRVSGDALAATDNLKPTERLHELALEHSPVACIVVDSHGNFTLANLRARTLLSIDARDVGRPLKDLGILCLTLDLRGLMNEAHVAERTIRQAHFECRSADGRLQYFETALAPLLDEAETAVGMAICFPEVTSTCGLPEELRASREEIQTANEELRLSNEALESANEELQSTNHRLETLNEELQTVNEELRQRIDGINQLNALLQSVIASLAPGAVVINQSFDILMWSPRAEDLWGLRENEARGKSIFALDTGLPADELRPLVRPVLSGEADSKEIVLDAVNRHGRSIRCRISCTPLRANRRKRDGAVLLMDEVR